MRTTDTPLLEFLNAYVQREGEDLNYKSENKIFSKLKGVQII